MSANTGFNLHRPTRGAVQQDAARGLQPQPRERLRVFQRPLHRLPPGPADSNETCRILRCFLFLFVPQPKRWYANVNVSEL